MLRRVGLDCNSATHRAVLHCRWEIPQQAHLVYTGPHSHSQSSTLSAHGRRLAGAVAAAQGEGQGGAVLALPAAHLRAAALRV